MEYRIKLLDKMDRVVLDYVPITQIHLGCSRIAHYPIRPKEYLEPIELIVEDYKGCLEIFNNWSKCIVSEKEELFDNIPYSVEVWLRDCSNQIFRKFVYNSVKLISIDYGIVDSKNQFNEKPKFKVIISYEKLDIITIQEEEWKW